MDKRYSLEADINPILEGKVPLPNFERQDVTQVMNNVAACGHSMLAKWGWATGHDSRDLHKQWAMFFLTPTAMGNANSGAFDGTGYVVVYNSRYKEGPIAGHFSICKHEKVDAPGANHSRGWHPGHCKKCGIDMTVDSGD
jgi:hypothetical protein